jgi:Ca-activated chloride channel homolog
MSWLTHIGPYFIESPWYIVLVFPLVVALLLAVRYKLPRIQVSSMSDHRASVNGQASWILFLRLPHFLEALAIIFLIIALIRPQLGSSQTVEETEGVDMILALDLSGSMQAYDTPSNYTKEDAYNDLVAGKIRPRIEVAKDQLSQFIDKRPHDRLGLIAFSDYPFTACPPTLDHDFLKLNLRRMDAGVIGRSTEIAGPIASSVNRLKESKARRRVLVLFTDGKNTRQGKITPRQAAKIAKEYDIIIYTVGIGSEKAFIKQQTFFNQYSLVPFGDNFDKPLLQDIAKETGGAYFEASDESSFQSVMQQIDTLETVKFEQSVYIDYDDLYQPWLIAAALLLLVGFALEHTLCMRIP